MPIYHHAYQSLCILIILPINHHAYQPYDLLSTGFSYFEFLQDSQLTKLSPFSWQDFVEYTKAEKSGRSKSRRKVKIVHLLLVIFFNYNPILVLHITKVQ